MLEIESLTKRFDTVTAVSGLSLTVGRGEVLGFLGPNGAGKTTTMKMVTGFLVPDGGTARICGHDIVTDTLAAQARLGYLPEGAPAYGEMTPREFLTFTAAYAALDAMPGARRWTVLWHRQTWRAFWTGRSRRFSKGFRRRVGLAQAILHDPEVLILDEPTDGLDPNQKHAVRELIRAIAATKTIVISTHVLEEVEAICSRAVIIDKGPPGRRRHARDFGRAHAQRQAGRCLSQPDDRRGRSSMTALCSVFRREFAAYFATPIAFVFLAIFLFAMGAFTFYVGHFYQNGFADLTVFFNYHPWLYLLLIPALAMRLWAEEKRSGTIELLLTLPMPVWATVLGKFFAAWVFAGLALALTFPVWLTVNYLGAPDNGVILAAYVGSFLMAGAYLAIGACISAATSNQVIAFVISVVVCFLFTAAGAPLVMNAFQGWAPLALVDVVSSFSFLSHFNAITAGVIDLRDLIFFTSLIGLFLYINTLIVSSSKGG